MENKSVRKPALMLRNKLVIKLPKMTLFVLNYNFFLSKIKDK